MSATNPRPLRVHRWRPAVVAALVLLLAVLGVLGWHKIRDTAVGPDAYAPSCSWRAHVEHANSDQAGLIRCYLRAVAHHSASDMRAVARAGDDNGPTGFSTADFAHTADARAGAATVMVTANDVDGADAAVSIRYADGARDEHEIHLANPASSHSWRFWDIGTYPSESNAPPTAAP